MTTSPRLENLRGSKVGDIQLLLDSGEAISAAFHDHAAQAEWHTINALLRLAGNPVAGAANERIAVVEWWRTIESLIALLHRVAVAESERGLRAPMPRLGVRQRPDFQTKWSVVASWFSNRTYGVPRDLRRRVLALRDWRNSFEHSSRESTIKTANSRLGARPSEANITDAMEAMAICVEVCSSVRYVAQGLDLMPQVVAPSQKYVLFVPLDQLTTGVLFPVYYQVIRLLGLGTEIEPYPPRDPLPGESLVPLAARPAQRRPARRTERRPGDQSRAVQRCRSQCDQDRRQSRRCR